MSDKVVQLSRAPKTRKIEQPAAQLMKGKAATLTQADVTKLMLTKLMGSLLTKTDAAKLGFQATTAQGCAALPSPLPIAAAGFVIPYFDMSGNPTTFWRYRYLESTKRGFLTQTDKKEVKYVQPKRTLNELYLPPTVNWKKIASDVAMPLVITEGELKAACACKLGIPTIGLGGVWCFKSDKRGVILLDQFAEFEWMGRVVYVAYDDDAATNPMVMSAEGALCMALTRLGAKAHIVRLPSVYDDKKTGLDDYLLAESKQAFEEILAQTPAWHGIEELHAMNQEVLYVEDPGFIIRLDTAQLLRPKDFVDHAFSHYRHTIEVEMPNGGTKKQEVSTAKFWLQWPQRNTVKRMVYAPGQQRITANNEFNTWSGWAVEPEKGSVKLWDELLNHLFPEQPAERSWFEQWLAYPLQYPGTKLFSAAVLWGLGQGTGKSLIGYSMFQIYGHNAREIKDKHLTGNNNGWAANRQFIMGDEITGGDKRGMSDHMKGIITQEKISINEKYIKEYEIADCINYYFTSNHPDAFFLEDDDRRFFIHEVVPKSLPDEFYAAYEKWIKSEAGAAALFYHLLEVDTSDFAPKGRALMTASKMDMIISGKSDVAAFAANLKMDPDTVLRMDNIKLPYSIFRADELLAIYDPGRTGRVTVNGLGREMRKAGIPRAAQGNPIVTSSGQYRFWIVRDVEKLSKLSPAEIGRIYDKERGNHEPKKKKF